jgi:hypothetical protein
MKGPSERLKYDLRRVWECPVCKRCERTTGAVAFRHCSCQMKQMEGRAVVMKLVVDGVQRVGPAIVIRHEEPASSPVPTEAVETPAEQSSAVSDARVPDPVSE